MKKKIILFLLILFTANGILTADNVVIASTYNSNFTYSDIIKYFFIESLKVDRERYPYVVYNYIVFPDKEEQNYSWGVCRNNGGYWSENGYVNAISIRLYTSNGMYNETYYTSPSYNTMSQVTKKGYRIYSQEKPTNYVNSYAARNDQHSTVLQFSQESELMLKKYGFSMDSEEKMTFDNWVASELMN